MGFFTLLKSLDELLYDVMSWLIFYPITLWRAVTRPLAMMDYADVELADSDDQQYTDTLSPPLFLLVTLLLSHGLELAIVGQNEIVVSRTGLSGLINDDTQLLIFRVAVFSVFPLLMAARLVRRQKLLVDRDTLRAPFYSQCYAAAPFALVLGVGGILMTRHAGWEVLTGLAVAGFALLWYGTLQARWFAQHLGVSLLRGWVQASIAMVESLVLVIAIGWLFT